MTLLALMDVLLLLGCTLRVTRLITTDHLGHWWIRDPAAAWGRRSAIGGYVDALVTCPFCIGFWLGAALTVSLLLVGGPGDAAEPWRWVTAAFTLNYVAAHINARIDVTEDQD